MEEGTGDGAPPVRPVAFDRRLPSAGLRLIEAAADLDDFHVRPNIPAKMERNIRVTASIPEWETVLALVDCTYLNSGKDALAIGQAGIYHHHMVSDDAPTFQPWESLARNGVSNEGGPNSPTVRLGGWAYQVSGSGIDRAGLCRLLADLAGLFPASADDPPEVESTRPEGSDASILHRPVVDSDRPSVELDVAEVVLAACGLAVIGGLLTIAAVWLAAPWGPMTTEPGTVTAIDVSDDWINGRNSTSWLVDVETQDGDAFRLDSPEASRYAEVGRTVTVERSAWTGVPMAIRLEEGTFGKGEGFGALARGAGLVAVAAGAAGVLRACGLLLRRWPAGLAVLVLVPSGSWLGFRIVVG